MSDPYVELMELLHAVSRGLFGQVEDVLAQYGFPTATFAVMDQICREPGITASEIARRTGMVKSHVATTVDFLVRQGLLTKEPDPIDQRLLRLYTREHPPQHLAQFKPEVHKRLAAVLAPLSAGELEAILAGLRILRTAVQQAEGDHS